jgi:hypothetical protein
MDEAKKILKLKLPGIPHVMQRNIRKRMGRPPGSPISSKQLEALRAHAVPKGKVLNPYGRNGSYKEGTTYFRSYKEVAMKRKRLQLEVKKAIALEAHELQQLARENAAAAMETLVEISINKRAPEPARIAASQVILDRAYGKASQTSITANISNGTNTKEIDSTELDKRINQTLKRVEELTNRAPKAGKSKKRPVDLRFVN